MPAMPCRLPDLAAFLGRATPHISNLALTPHAQGHAGPCFMTFHRAWMLELENSLLSVAPALKALPYWDVTMDRCAPSLPPPRP